MTSEERREARYRRRKAAREAKRLEAAGGALDYDDVFTFMHLYRSAGKCFRGVGWKPSVQAYRSQRGIRVAEKYLQMRAGKFHQKKSPEHWIRERGHERRINSIHIEDRVPEKCNSYYSLKPVLHRGLIWDNYASQEGKGTTRARARLKCMLERHIRRYGFTGGMILFDFSKFFDSMLHELIRETMQRHYADGRMTEMNLRIVQKNRRKRGMILGSENSQDFAISCPSRIDHMIKDVLRAEGYGRYMDDGWIIDPDMEKLREIFQRLREAAAKAGFTINPKKSRVIPFGTPFSMLKRKYTFTASGGIIMRPVRASLIRERRKLKRLHRRTMAGTVGRTAGLESLKAWEASLIGCRCERIREQMRRLYNRLFIWDWLNGKEETELCIG